MLALLAACSGEPPASAPSLAGSRPNVVLVLADDLRADALSFSGGPIETPNLDWLAQHGVWFENAYVPTSLCTPSRASLLTGRYPHAHGLLDNVGSDDPLASLPFLPELLHDAGYETGFVGKWHLPGDVAAAQRGFDAWVSFPDQGEYFDQDLWVDGELEPATEHLSDALTDHAEAFVRRARTRPFFLVLSHKAPHAPYVPPKRHASLLTDLEVDLPDTLREPAAARPAHFEAIRKQEEAFGQRFDERDLLAVVRGYHALVPGIDESVWRLLQALNETGALNDTLFVFASDNGFLLGEHASLYKRRVWEPSIRVPLALYWPGRLPEGLREPHLVSLVDLMPTLLELAGVAVPAGVQGRSLLPLLEPAGTTPPAWRQRLLAYEPADLRAGVVRPREYALRRGSWKYAVLCGAGLEEALYDLAADPGERENLAGRPEHARELDGLRADLAAELAALGVPAEWRAELAPLLGAP